MQIVGTSQIMEDQQYGPVVAIPGDAMTALRLEAGDILLIGIEGRTLRLFKSADISSLSLKTKLGRHKKSTSVRKKASATKGTAKRKRKKKSSR